MHPLRPLSHQRPPRLLLPVAKLEISLITCRQVAGSPIVDRSWGFFGNWTQGRNWSAYESLKHTVNTYFWTSNKKFSILRRDLGPPHAFPWLFFLRCLWGCWKSFRTNSVEEVRYLLRQAFFNGRSFSRRCHRAWRWWRFVWGCLTESVFWLVL